MMTSTRSTEPTRKSPPAKPRPDRLGFFTISSTKRGQSVSHRPRARSLVCSHATGFLLHLGRSGKMTFENGSPVHSAQRAEIRQMGKTSLLEANGHDQENGRSTRRQRRRTRGRVEGASKETTDRHHQRLTRRPGKGKEVAFPRVFVSLRDDSGTGDRFDGSRCMRSATCKLHSVQGHEGKKEGEKEQVVYVEECNAEQNEHCVGVLYRTNKHKQGTHFYPIALLHAPERSHADGKGSPERICPK